MRQLPPPERGGTAQRNQNGNPNRENFMREYQPMNGPSRNVCFNCGGTNHISTQCANAPLPFDEQKKLREDWQRNRQAGARAAPTGANATQMGPSRGPNPVVVNRAAVEESEFDEIEADAHIQMHEDSVVRMAYWMGEESSDSEGDGATRHCYELAMKSLERMKLSDDEIFDVRVNPGEETGMKRARVESDPGQGADGERRRDLGRDSARVPRSGEPARDPVGRDSARVPRSGEPARDPVGRDSARVPRSGEPARDPVGRDSARVPSEPDTGDESTGRDERRRRRARRQRKADARAGVPDTLADDELRARPRPKMLERVQGMLDQEPFDFHKWLTTTRIDMTVLQYLQESPSARRALGWEMSLANPARRARKRRPDLFDIRHCDIQDIRPSSHFGSFYITITVPLGRKRYTFRKVVLDPGSDLNLVTEGAATSLNLDLISTKSTTMTGVAMRTADGARHRLRHLAEVDFEVEGARWRQEFFLLPNAGDCGFSMLLGLPWLYDAWAQFDVRNFMYTIQSEDGMIIKLQGKSYKPRRYLAIEYPVQVEKRIDNRSGAIREKYVYDESPKNLVYLGGAKPDDSATSSDDVSHESQRVRMMQLAEVVRDDGEAGVQLGRVPYIDPLSYLENYGAAGSASEEASEWVRQAGGEGPAQAVVASFAQAMADALAGN
ncbi:hypothetical protein EDC01DRAFT_628660 [Geopyxis carbonaria]|nr:hypothetical protein EDC01DRAFT_628660 [Geopyxis carbonaria]